MWLWWGVAFLPCPCPCGQHLRANRRWQSGYKEDSGTPIRDHMGFSLPKEGKEEVMWEESEAPCTHLLPEAGMNLSAQLRHFWSCWKAISFWVDVLMKAKPSPRSMKAGRHSHSLKSASYEQCASRLQRMQLGAYFWAQKAPSNIFCSIIFLTQPLCSPTPCYFPFCWWKLLVKTQF